MISARGSLYFRNTLLFEMFYSIKLPLLLSHNDLISFEYSGGKTIIQLVMGSKKYSALSLSGASAALSISMIF